MLEDTAQGVRNKDFRLHAKLAISWRPYLGVFLVATAVCAVHHIFEPGIKTALQFDGRHYFESCQRLTALVLSLFTGKIATIQAAEQVLRPWILYDGPVLPLVFGLPFFFFGHVPVSADWSLLLIWQTVFQSICAVLIFAAVKSLTGSSKASCLAALAWILYPPAVIATGRLMTETLASCLLLALPLSCHWARTNRTGGIVSGLTAAALILLKPGMIPSVVLTTAVVLAFSKKRALLAITMAVGLALGLSPWLAYTKFATGKATLLVQRSPVHNTLIGWDPETGGWQTSPASGFEQAMGSNVMAGGSEPLSVLAGIWRCHPWESLRILGEKPGHLYLVPWNDYRATVWGINADAQQLIHWCYLSLILFGSTCLIVVRRKESVQEAILPILYLAAPAGQLVYLMFEPVCRYAFPLMAFAPILAAAGVCGFLSAQAKERRLTGLIAASCTAVVLILLALSARSASLRLSETPLVLSPGDKLDVNFLLSKPVDTRFDTAMLLVDCDRRFTPTQVKIDDHLLAAPQLLPFALFDEQKSRSFNLLREFAYTFGQDVDDFRQWRAMPVPVADLAGKKSIHVSMRQGQGPATIYGLQDGSLRTMLGSDYLDVNRMLNSTESLEPRVLDPVKTGGSTKLDVEVNGKGIISMSPAVHLGLAMPAIAAPAIAAPGTTAPTKAAPDQLNAVALAKLKATDAKTNTPPAVPIIDALNGAKDWSSMEANKHGWCFNIKPQLFDPLLSDGKSGSIVINRAVLKAATSNAATITLPEALWADDKAQPASSNPLARGLAQKRPPYLSLRLSGQLKCDRERGALGLVISSVTASGAESLLLRLPKSVAAKADWQNFEIADILPVKSRDPIKRLTISVFPGPWQQIAGYGCDKSCANLLIKDLKLILEPKDLPSLSGKHVFFY